MEPMKWIAHVMATNFNVPMVVALKIDGVAVSGFSVFDTILASSFNLICILYIDGWNDCLDGSDEAIELCAGKNQLSKKLKFQKIKNLTKSLLFQPFHADTMRSDASTAQNAFESQMSAMVSMIVAVTTIPMKLPVHFITNARQSNFNAKATDTAFQSISSVMVNHNVLVSIKVIFRWFYELQCLIFHMFHIKMDRMK